MLSYTSLTFFGPVQTAGKGGGIARKLQTCQVYKPLKWQLLGVPSPADVLHERMRILAMKVSTELCQVLAAAQTNQSAALAMGSI